MVSPIWFELRYWEHHVGVGNGNVRIFLRSLLVNNTWLRWEEHQSCINKPQLRHKYEFPYFSFSLDSWHHIMFKTSQGNTSFNGATIYIITEMNIRTHAPWGICKFIAYRYTYQKHTYLKHVKIYSSNASLVHTTSVCYGIVNYDNLPWHWRSSKLVVKVGFLPKKRSFFVNYFNDQHFGVLPKIRKFVKAQNWCQCITIIHNGKSEATNKSSMHDSSTHVIIPTLKRESKLMSNHY